MMIMCCNILFPFSRTLIDMSLAVRSLDLDFEKGTFRTDGYMKLRWTDKRQVEILSCCGT